jgi:hypothetical protein
MKSKRKQEMKMDSTGKEDTMNNNTNGRHENSLEYCDGGARMDKRQG